MLFFLNILAASVFGFVDVERDPSSFILEARKIEIEGVKEPFNPSIVQVQGGYLLSFRFFDSLTGKSNKMGLVLLDRNFKEISPFQEVFLPAIDPSIESTAQDPRLIAVNDRLFVVYSNRLDPKNKYTSRMVVAELTCKEGNCTLGDPFFILDFPFFKEDAQQKHWVPFTQNGNLFLSYTIQPHRVFKISYDGRSCDLAAETDAMIQWPYGEVRGGTQAIALENEYLAIFHSTIEMKSEQSNGQKISHYFMGAYTFSKDPPFELKSISRNPIVAKGFYSPPYYETWKPLRCIFPMGLIVDEECAYILMGRQDHEIWLIKCDLEGLLNSLSPVFIK